MARLRVVQWATGSVGAAAIKGVGDTVVVATAAHCVNAVPATCAAPAGIQSFFDLPLITARAAPGLSR